MTQYKAPIRRVDRGKCEVWAGPKIPDGYGVIFHAGRSVLAHRYVYERQVGPIPEGLELDHLCRVRLCVNPDHLEPVTHQENTLRGEGPTAINARKTHCPQGHPFAGDNLLRRSDGGRRCRICNTAAGRERMRRWRARRSAA